MFSRQLMGTHSVIADAADMATAPARPAEWDYSPSRDDAVISLTSLPTRLDILPMVLSSLMRQSLDGLPIHLHLARHSTSPEKSWMELPNWLKQLEAVRIVLHEDDPGPMLKYLPALGEAEDRLVLVADDDVIYPPDFAERLVAADRRLEGRHAVCFRGWKIHRNLSWEASRLSEPEENSDVRVGIVCGHGGYAVRRRHLDWSALNAFRQAPADCRMMDDVWISGHLSRAGTEKIVIPGDVRYKLPVTPALGGDRARRNDLALAWFADDWLASDLEPA